MYQLGYRQLLADHVRDVSLSTAGVFFQVEARWYYSFQTVGT